MNINALDVERAAPALNANAILYDPLDDDRPDDIVVPTTRRGLTRLALVAAETGARFQREGIGYDAMAWLLAPRHLFSGSTAIEACLGREDCLRAVLLHGLSLGLDAQPGCIDALVADKADKADEPSSVSSPRVCATPENGRADKIVTYPPVSAKKPRLFTATVVAVEGSETLHAFHASLACDEAELADRLYRRVGVASVDARIVAGFDPTDPLVDALVSSVVCDTLMLIASDPESPLGAGLDLNIEQRFLT